MDLLFYDRKGLCRACVFSVDDGESVRAPVNYQRGDIDPGESAGISLTIREVQGIYSLRKGCYGFYSIIRSSDSPRDPIVSVSNVGVICVPGA